MNSIDYAAHVRSLRLTSQRSIGRAKRGRMILVEWLRTTFPRATALVEPHFHVLRKAVSFALIGVVNVLIDTTVFLLAYSYISASPWALRPLDAFANGCQCVDHTSI